MKTIIAILFASASFLLGATPNGNVYLAWDYAPSELSTNLTFRVYWSTNSLTPISTWSMLTNVPGTQTNCAIKVAPGVNFFVLTASNIWCESDFSNVAATPPLPRNDGRIWIKKAD
jgi:hypothetical protein